MKMLLKRLKLVLVTIPLHLLKWWGSMESKIINNKGLIPDAKGNHSVYLFSTHKCASTFLNGLLKDLAERIDKKHIDIETCLATAPLERDKLYADSKFTNELLKRKGYFFGVFRYAFSVLPPKGTQKLILVLRDPRDVLTSQFFSIAYSHPVLTEKFLQKRAHALAVGIDKHVMDMSDRFLKTYSDYLKNYLGREDVLLIKYEDMIASFPEVLNGLLDFIQYPKKEETLKFWSNNNPFIIESEDNRKHKRKITPGDYKEKLNPETIAALNKKFGSILSRLGYESQ